MGDLLEDAGSYDGDFDTTVRCAAGCGHSKRINYQDALNGEWPFCCGRHMEVVVTDLDYRQIIFGGQP